MKKCPFCAEEIQDAAIKCRFCGEFLGAPSADAGPPSGQEKWYYKTTNIVIAFLCVGPFALPLVWFKPKLRMEYKLLITACVLIITYFISVALVRSVQSLMQYYQIIF